nr:MAG TPA: hypothetical protein [Bacteriophage sp.]DAX62682.1 MAG TPA: hypothetical protein [Caudoviricetes sp.]DAY59586.1 MAG TPA: hypothetical protein [Caudoviricetes sp.]
MGQTENLESPVNRAKGLASKALRTLSLTIFFKS